MNFDTIIAVIIMTKVSYDISKEPVVLILIFIKDGGSTFLRNVGTHL
jgi:hypothetical protein